MATWSKVSKNAATFTKATVHSASWTKLAHSVSGLSYLLKEDGGYILQEDGSSKLVLEQSSSTGTSWTKATKN